jgi:prolyl-tRNA editing enzyme YbaK/EbsC (Cys-tRNA(Pro) deacylase)
VRIEVAAGLDESTFGTDAMAIAAAIGAADSGAGVVVLMDLGSAVLSAELALDLLDDPAARDRVLLCPAPLVEGAVAAAAAARAGGTLADAAAEARAAGVGPEDAAKDVVLRDGDTFILAVIPASERLDLAKVETVLEADARPRLATEDEMADRFPEFELGALPPFGPLHDLSELLDRRLLDHDRVLCASGDHRHSLRIDPSEIVRVANARVADICQD